MELLIAAKTVSIFLIITIIALMLVCVGLYVIISDAIDLYRGKSVNGRELRFAAWLALGSVAVIAVIFLVIGYRPF